MEESREQGTQPTRPSLAGRALSQPQLLPAFEPISSSPPVPRALKRKLDGSKSFGRSNGDHYPSPMPTSDTAIPPSSPGPLKSRPPFHRNLSTLSERQPLGTVPSVNLPASGKEVLMGRSSNSSHHQLSANRAISRIHVRASYRPATDGNDSASILLECLGWNGCKIHCRGKVTELAKGDTFSDKNPADLMLDVQDARVLLRWPSLKRSTSTGQLSDATWDDESSPIRRRATPLADLPSSPPLPRAHLQSPVSPSPLNPPQFTASTTFIGTLGTSPDHPTVQVYEDASGDEEDASVEKNDANGEAEVEVTAPSSQATNSSSSLSDLENISDNDEENDPIIHSFFAGPNLLPRMASISASSPERRRNPLKASVSPQQSMHPDLTLKIDVSPIRNHVINQLAFGSRNSIPLSTIMSNLPPSMKNISEDVSSPSQIENKPIEPTKRDLTDAELKKLLEETVCVGEIAREGKDAAGKKLEDEFYYVPEMDTDEGRRDAVLGLGKPGMRSVRKQHKQYYWKRPRH